MKLSRTQQELYDYMKSGGVVLYMSGINAYWFRADSFKHATAAARSLIAKGVARNVGGWRDSKLVLLKEAA